MEKEIKSFKVGDVTWKVLNPLYLLNVDNIKAGFVESSINSIQYVVDEDHETGETFWKYHSVWFDIKYSILGVERYLKNKLVTISISAEDAPHTKISEYLRNGYKNEEIIFGNFYISPSKRQIIDTLQKKLTFDISFFQSKIDEYNTFIKKEENEIKLTSEKLDILNSLKI